MGNSFSVSGDKSRTFVWKIEGFSSLVNLEAKSHFSQAFEFGGYKWHLMIKPNEFDGRIGERCISLYLCLPSCLKSDLVVHTFFNMYIYDQLSEVRHHIQQANWDFQSEADHCGFHNMIAVEAFKDPTFGFLVNDNCTFGIEFIEVHAQNAVGNRLFKLLPLQKSTVIPHSSTWKLLSYKWKIKNFSELAKPRVLSSNFVIGGHKWKLIVHPNGNRKNCLSVFLELESCYTLPFRSKLNAKFTLCLLDQINGNHKKYTGQYGFDEKKAVSCGWVKFLSLDDFRDPSKGFLINDTCIIKAFVTVIGLEDVE